MIKEVDYFKGNPPALDVSIQQQKSKLLIMTGENAMGKSFMRRLYHQAMRKYGDIECIPVSQEARTTSGIHRAFMFGDEGEESTGAISCHSVKGGISTCKARKEAHAIIFDEPDIGLSDSYARGLGIVLRDFVKKVPKKTFAVIVTSHNRNLIKELLPLNPNHLRFGSPMTLDEWVNREVEPASPEELGERSIDTWRKISAILEKRKSK